MENTQNVLFVHTVVQFVRIYKGVLKNLNCNLYLLHSFWSTLDNIVPWKFAKVVTHLRHIPLATMLTSDHLHLQVIAGKGSAANDIMNRNAIRTKRIGVPSPYSFMDNSVVCWRPVTSFTTEVKVFHPECAGVSFQICLPIFLKKIKFSYLFQSIIKYIQIIFWQVYIFFWPYLLPWQPYKIWSGWLNLKYKLL